MSDTLSVGKLLALVESLPPRPEIERIIVGAPCIPRETALKWITRRVLWIHADMWAAIPMEKTSRGPGLFGIPVEHFSWKYHSQEWREFFQGMLAAPTPRSDAP